MCTKYTDQCSVLNKSKKIQTSLKHFLLLKKKLAAPMKKIENFFISTWANFDLNSETEHFTVLDKIE